MTSLTIYMRYTWCGHLYDHIYDIYMYDRACAAVEVAVL